MRKMLRIVGVAVLLLICSSTQAQDIEIREFRQNVTSLIGSVNPVYDNTGQACAVIRFSVRDTTFVVEGNLGVVKRMSQLGEILVYVPATTKRLTIRHEGLLPLRNYEIPVKLDPKKTYDAYLLAMTAPRQQTKPAERAVPQIRTNENATVGTATSGKEQQARTSGQKKQGAKVGVRPMIGLGFQALAMMGPSLSVGAAIGHHQIELSGALGLKKSDELHLYDSDHNLIATRQYTPTKIQFRYGYEISVAKGIDLTLTPMIGGSLNIFNSQSEDNEYREYFKRASSFSLTPAVRVSYLVGKNIAIHMTPEFALGLYKSANCKVISNSNKNFKKWTDGFNLSLGVNYIF